MRSRTRKIHNRKRRSLGMESSWKMTDTEAPVFPLVRSRKRCVCTFKWRTRLIFFLNWKVQPFLHTCAMEDAVLLKRQASQLLLLFTFVFPLLLSNVKAVPIGLAAFLFHIIDSLQTPAPHSSTLLFGLRSFFDRCDPQIIFPVVSLRQK